MSNFIYRGQKRPFRRRLAFYPKFNFCYRYFFGWIKLYRSTVGWPGWEKDQQLMMAHLAAKHKDDDMARVLREEDKMTAKRERDIEKKAQDETAMHCHAWPRCPSERRHFLN